MTRRFVAIGFAVFAALPEVWAASDCRFPEKPAAYPAEELTRCVREAYRRLVEPKPANAGVLEPALLRAERRIRERVEPKRVLAAFEREAGAAIGGNAGLLRDLEDRDRSVAKALDAAAGGAGADASPGPRQAAAGPAAAPSAGGAAGSAASSGGPIREDPGTGTALGPSAAPSPSGPEPGVAAMADALLARYGRGGASGSEPGALDLVIRARADAGEAERRRLSEAAAPAAPFTDSRDPRLAKLDHYLNNDQYVRANSRLCPRDPWYRGSWAFLRRAPRALGAVAATAGYDACKLVYEKTGRNPCYPLATFAGASASSPATTAAAMYGAVRAAYTADPDCR